MDTPKRDWFKSWLRHSFGVLRVSVYGVVVFTALAWWAGGSARGAADEASLRFGRQLDQLRDVLGTTKTLDLNGERLHVSTAMVELDVGAALDRFEQLCAEHPSALLQSLDAAVAPSARRGTGVIRSAPGDDGVVLCFVQRGEPRSPVAMAEAFLETRDLSAIGDLVYVYAKKTTSGRTHLITVWTRGSFKILDLFPAQGDSPGTDSLLAVRPPHSRRLLSGTTPDAPYGLRVYESERAPEALLEPVHEAMQQRGWKPLDPSPEAPLARGYLHDSGVQALVVAAARQGRTVISVVELGQPRPASSASAPSVVSSPRLAP